MYCLHWRHVISPAQRLRTTSVAGPKLLLRHGSCFQIAARKYNCVLLDSGTCTANCSIVLLVITLVVASQFCLICLIMSECLTVELGLCDFKV